MEEGAYAAQLITAVFFLIAGQRLIRLNWRTGEAPELLLGLYFALMGVAYVGWVLPFMMDLGPLTGATDFGAWIVYSIGVVPCLRFIRIVFRPESGWAQFVVVGCITALAVSATVLTLNGDRYPSLDNPFFWTQWLGYTVPCVWLMVEATLCRNSAVRRARIGLGDPVVTNRYLLLAVFGGFQVLACLSDILLGFDLSTAQGASGLADTLLGGCELAGIGVLWLAFFPPPAYLAWLSGSNQPADQAA
jgi:hypothetical protein